MIRHLSNRHHFNLSGVSFPILACRIQIHVAILPLLLFAPQFLWFFSSHHFRHLNLCLCLTHHLDTLPSLSPLLDPLPADSHLHPLVLYLNHDIEQALRKDHSEDYPPQSFLSPPALILHVVGESRQESRDEQHAPLIQELKPVLSRIFEGLPQAEVDELDHTRQME